MHITYLQISFSLVFQMKRQGAFFFFSSLLRPLSMICKSQKTGNTLHLLLETPHTRALCFLLPGSWYRRHESTGTRRRGAGNLALDLILLLSPLLEYIDHRFRSTGQERANESRGGRQDRRQQGARGRRNRDNKHPQQGRFCVRWQTIKPRAQRWRRRLLDWSFRVWKSY